MDMLARGAGPYDVAKVLVDTVATVEKHYPPFVKDLRNRRECQQPTVALWDRNRLCLTHIDESDRLMLWLSGFR
jgi:hypothetical protein